MPESVFKYLRFILLSGFLLQFFAVNGQDVYFSQHYASKPQVNPALTGTRSCPTISLIYRNQWPELQKAFITYAAGYDQFFKALHGGIGAYFTKDAIGNGSLNTIAATGIYAYQARLNKAWTMHIGLAAGYLQRSYTINRLVLPSAIQSQSASPLEAEVYKQKQAASMLDFSAGLLLYSNTFYGGISAFHVNPGFALNGSDETLNLPIRMSAQVGAQITPGGHPDAQFRMLPSVIVQKQESFTRLSTGLYFNWHLLTAGGWYHQSLEFKPQFYTIMAGFVYKQLQIAYSNDFLISSFTKKIMPSHEVSIVLKLNCMQKKKKWEAISCPDF